MPRHRLVRESDVSEMVFRQIIHTCRDQCDNNPTSLPVTNIYSLCKRDLAARSRRFPIPKGNRSSPSVSTIYLVRESSATRPRSQLSTYRYMYIWLCEYNVYINIYIYAHTRAHPCAHAHSAPLPPFPASSLACTNLLTPRAPPSPLAKIDPPSAWTAVHVERLRPAPSPTISVHGGQPAAQQRRSTPRHTRSIPNQRHYKIDTGGDDWSPAATIAVSDVPSRKAVTRNSE